MKKALTLIELLVSISVLIIVFSITFIAIRYSTNIYTNAIKKANNLKVIMRVYDILSNQINNIYLSKNIKENLIYNEYQFQLTTKAGLDYEGISVVRYKLDNKILYYKEIPYPDITLFYKLKNWKYLSNLDKLTLEFIKDEKVYKEWSKDNLPDFVKIKISYNKEEYESIIEVGINMSL